MLQQVFRDAVADRGISARQAAREIGVAHTTVIRILEGQNPSHGSLQKVAEWLGTPAEAFALVNREGDEGIAAQLLVFLMRNPKLAKAFQDVMDAFNSGKIEDSDVEEILKFIHYRLS